ncbi:MAG: ATP-binding protein [bacterium]|nr:ATP-binding protein [bacterium]
MFKETSKLVIYHNISDDSILKQLAYIFKEFEEQAITKEEATFKIYAQIHNLLELATTYGFNHNLWQNYLTYLLITTETPFSITCEKTGALDGSINIFAKKEFKIFMELFHYDFSKIEKELGVDCFITITNYQAIPKLETTYNKNVSEKVVELSEKLAAAKDEHSFYELVTAFYRDYGVGMLGLNKAFRVNRQKEEVVLTPITNTEIVRFDNIVGYESQKQKLRDNTEAFLQGKKANNVLMFGDSGTGKSTSIKALLNEYYEDGLRIIEIYKHQFEDLSKVIAMIKNRNYKFIIYMDDLSFEEFEIEYKYLKAVIEGGLEIKPRNVLIYATSNRRHLIRETWSDREDVRDEEMHHSDTMQEKLSLVARFGVTIHFSKPNKNQFNEIVLGLARRYKEITYTDDELCLMANQWELSHGGMSGRCAEQFISYVLGKLPQQAEK